MKQFPNTCEVCGSDNWSVLGKKTYDSAALERSDAYHRKRFRVLFEKWFPGVASVDLTFACCNHCGFVCYWPRPERVDIDKKYRFLEEMGQDYGQAPCSSAGERKRSRVLLTYLSEKLDLGNVAEVLDYGGGDGRLMEAFLDKGLSCFNVDYNQSCIPGVTKLADTLDELPAERLFDLIVCSHVIEHVADPLKVVKALSRHLRSDGCLFVEVPMEIWRKPPLPYEPVTHINFFTPNSVWNLFSLAGLDVRESKLTGYLHPNGTWLHGVRALARRNAEASGSCAVIVRAPDVAQYVRPNLSSQLRYYSANPHACWRAVKRKWTRTGLRKPQSSPTKLSAP